MLGDLRRIKDAGEIELIRKATNASIAGQSAALKAIKPGVTEREIAALQQYEFGKRGCERPAYAPIVGSGYDSTVLHYSEDTGTLKDGELVVMDVAGEYSMYASDITRTAPVNGQLHAAPAGDLRHRVRRAAGGDEGVRCGQVDALPDKSDDSLVQGRARLHQQLTARTCMASRWASTSSTASAITSAWRCTIRARTPRRCNREWSSPSSRASISRKRRLACASRIFFTSMRDGKLVDYTAALPHTADEVERAMKK